MKKQYTDELQKMGAQVNFLEHETVISLPCGSLYKVDKNSVTIFSGDENMILINNKTFCNLEWKIKNHIQIEKLQAYNENGEYIDAFSFDIYTDRFNEYYEYKDKFLNPTALQKIAYFSILKLIRLEIERFIPNKNNFFKIS